MTNWHIGCSGFYYPEWQGSFYPEALSRNLWFEYYCNSFNSLELNVTFYRFPDPLALRNWYRRSPENFSFSLKVPCIVTHHKKFRDCRKEIRDFYSVISDSLGKKLGCVLFQIHPGIRYSEENLELIVRSLNPSFRNVVEFCHTSWWRDDVYRELERHNVTFCSVSHPSLPHDIVRTSPAIYYRFHGAPELYVSSYDEETMHGILGRIRHRKSIDDVFIYFNNTARGAALPNARAMVELAEFDLAHALT